MAEKTILRAEAAYPQLAQAAAAYGCRDFARAVGIGEKRLMRLLRGETEFRQDEILRMAAVLLLDAREIDAYFFAPEVQKN